MRILAIDSALGACSAGVFENGQSCAEASERLQRGQAACLPALVAEVLAAAGPDPIGLVAVTIGPGSFTGLRAGLALAHGLAAGWGCPIVGVGIAEALARQVAPDRATGTVAPPIWVALHSRPGRVFLARDDTLASHQLDALPQVTGLPILTGNAAAAVAERLRDRGDQVDLRTADLPSPACIAVIALQRYRGERPALPAQPLYIDAPEAKRPAAP